MKYKYLTMFSLICLISILSLNFISAWTNTTFNNSLSIENITFTGNQNFTRYLNVPQGTPLTYGYINLSGYNASSQDINITDDTEDSTANSGTWNPSVCSGTSACAYDEDWDTYSAPQVANDVYVEETYTVGSLAGYENYQWIQKFSSFADQYGITVQVKKDSGAYETIISSSHSDFPCQTCGTKTWNIGIGNFTGTSITFKTIIKGSTDGGTVVAYYYEGKIYAFNSSSYTSNPILYIGNSNVWNYSGTFNQLNNKTNNLANSINSYLGTCSYSNGFCQVPFTFHSDISGVLQYSGLNFSGNYNGFVENSQTFSSTTFPSSSESFLINLTYDSDYYSSISATINYNGSSYLGTRTGTGNSAIFSKTLTIPSITSGNQTFYWTIALTNSTGTFYFNSTFQNQTINDIAFSRCNATISNPILVNYTIRDEESTSILIPATMKATFYYSLDTSYSKTYSLTTEANTTFQFCSNYNATFNVKSIIQLNNDSYIQRTYDLINNFTNDTTQKNLYLLSGTNGTNIIIEVKDSGNNPLPDYFVEIYRYYPETDSYSLVVGSTTDLYGQFSARLIENTIKYKFIFKDSTGVIKKTSEGITINCRATICVLPFIIEDTTDFFDEFNQTSYDWSFTFNNNTNIFTFSWNDVSGVSATNRLMIERIAANGSGIICNSTSTATSGSIVCSVGNSSSNYIGQVFRMINGIETRVATLNIKVGHEARDIFGKEGLIWSFFLFMTLISLGIYKPPIGIVLFLFGHLLLGFVVPITYLTIGVFIAECFIGGVFIWLFRS